MNQKQSIIDQYEKMNSVEISPEWNDQLFSKIRLKEETLQKSNAPIYAVAGVLILFLVNIFVLYNNVHLLKSNNLKAKYNAVATTFFIQTSSSKF